jgi:HD superfamily phosphohydrolase
MSGLNWIGLKTFVRREIERTFRVVIQTLVAPLISATLYIFIFGYVIGTRIDEIAGLIEGGTAAGKATLWRDLISGQLDADRMDYLLRDSYHAGVDYGRYDWRRLVASAELVEDVETGDYRFGVSAGGRHVAESLIIARYMMFSQVYFHKVRTVLDHHLHHAIEAILPDGRLPPPSELDAYLAWDDWRVLGAFANGEGGDHARRLKERDLYALVWETSEFPDENELARFANAEAALADFAPFAGDAGKSWYKTVRGEDLLVAAENPGGQTGPLSTCSGLVRHLNPSRCRRLYVAREHRQEAQARLSNPGGRGT